MLRKYFSKIYLPAVLGVAIEYYEIGLYGYMAPILVQVFLPQLHKLTAFLYYFGFEVIAALAQLCGAYFFGKMGDKMGRGKAMYLSMIGASCITFFIVIIPTYADIGVYAVCIFAVCRMLQAFFLGGEYNGGAIYCLEHEQDKNKHGLISGLYGASAVFGVFIAALVSTTIMHYSKEYFRIAYCVSLFFAILTYYLRLNMKETPEYLAQSFNRNDPVSKNTTFQNIIFFAIAMGSLLSGMLYGLPTRIFNVILPLTTDVSQVTIMYINCFMLVAYIGLLLLVGLISDRLNPLFIMKSSCWLIILLALPALVLIEQKTITSILLAKFIFTFLAASLIAPFHAWTVSISAVKNRYLQISTAYSLGKIGSILLLAYSIYLFERLDNLYLPVMILLLIALLFLFYLSFILKSYLAKRKNLH